MSLWKQLLLSAVAILIVGIVAAKMSPGTAAFLESHGFAAPMRVLGLAQSAAPEAEPASGAAPRAGNADATRAQTGAPGGRGGARKSTVVLQPAGTAVINDRVTALGTGEALQSVTVLPKASGTLIEVAVQSGARVTVGQVIARLDSRDPENRPRQGKAGCR